MSIDPWLRCKTASVFSLCPFCLWCPSPNSSPQCNLRCQTHCLVRFLRCSKTPLAAAESQPWPSIRLSCHQECTLEWGSSQGTSFILLLRISPTSDVFLQATASPLGLVAQPPWLQGGLRVLPCPFACSWAAGTPRSSRGGSVGGLNAHWGNSPVHSSATRPTSSLSIGLLQRKGRVGLSDSNSCNKTLEFGLGMNTRFIPTGHEFLCKCFTSSIIKLGTRVFEGSPQSLVEIGPFINTL